MLGAIIFLSYLIIGLILSFSLYKPMRISRRDFRDWLLIMTCMWPIMIYLILKNTYNDRK
jgi:Ca2+/Na+ antiporter